MKIRAAVRLTLLSAILTALVGAERASAQPGLAYPAGMGGQTAYAAPYSMEGEYTTAYGDPVVRPACFNGSCGQMGGGGCGGGGGYGGGGCGIGGSCGGGGRGGLLGGGGGGLLGGLLGGGSGYGPNIEQCGPHYFDFSGEYLRYKRQSSPIADGQILSTFGFANDDLANIENQAALTGSDLGGGNSNGYRLTGRLDIGALSLFELAYSGLYDEGNSATAFQQGTNSNQTLFSIFSRFGTATNGPVGVGGSAGPPTGENFEETDNAFQHTISFDSELHTVEASYRRYWVGYNPRISGTLLAGFRYTHLEEVLGYFSDPSTNNAPNGGTINIDFQTDNRLAGFQVGGDVWVTLLQGLRTGGELKVGIYNNDYQTGGGVVASDGSPTSVSRADGNQVAFLTEARLMAAANISACLTAKAGYEVLYISDLVLAGDNIGAAMPFGAVNGLTSTTMSDNGEVLYHGWHAGLEYIW